MPILFLLLAVLQSTQGRNLDSYCHHTYLTTTTCPAATCRVACLADTDDPNACTVRCLPRQCFEIPIEQCPLDYCNVIEGCGGKHVCYPKIIQPAGGCGTLGYQGGEVDCCEGLVPRCGVEYFGGDCDPEPEGSIYAVPVCIPCGDGICGQFENKCSCPEDCL